MTDHPLTPPPELVQQWLGDFFGCTVTGEVSDSERYLATQAVRWGADQQLNADCEWVQSYAECGDSLLAAMRPKPPSLAEEGQRILVENGSTLDGRVELDPEDVATIRAALNRLQELEQFSDDQG